jgi:hypothetical protein
VYLLVAVILALSVAIAWIATDWPHYCRLLGWCDGQGLL